MPHAKTKRDILLEQIWLWQKTKLNSAEFDDFRKKSLYHLLAEEWEREAGLLPEMVGEFKIPENLKRQHELALAYYELHRAIFSLQECEYYFRRYPFRGLAVSKSSHIRNVCEMYFSNISKVKNRIEKLLRTLCNIDQNTEKNHPLTEIFFREFKEDIDIRNIIHHEKSFSEMDIERISFWELLSLKRKDAEEDAKKSYRETSRKWAEIARDSAQRAERYLEAISAAILEKSLFFDDFG